MSETDLGGVAFWWLMLVGALSGAASLLASRQLMDSAQLRSGSNAMLAHLMEFRLFADEPYLILRAQRDLLAANGRLLRLLIVPLLLLMLPFAVVFSAAEAFFGRAPLRQGESAVVTAHCRNGLADVRLLTPDWIDLETSPVHVRSGNELSWRIRPTRASNGKLQLRWNSHWLEKTVSAQRGLHWISEERSGSLLGYLAHSRELPFSDGTVDWVRIQYPVATVFGFHWLVWFSSAACAGALFTTLGMANR